MVKAPAIVVLGPSGLAMARRLKAALPRAEVHGLRARTPDCDIVFDDTGAHLRDLFARGRPIVGLCAAGILIRALAPLLSDTHGVPPVLAMAEDGSAVVPLLGGLHGANDLAREIAALMDTRAAVTTAGDLRFGVALDDPPAGWHLANPGDVKAVSAALLAGASARLNGTAPWLAASGLPFAKDGRIELRVSETRQSGSAERLVYHPARLVLGVGCERGCGAQELIDLVEGVLAAAGLAPQALACVVSLDLKADEAAVAALAEHYGLPARFFDAARLNAEAGRLANPSDLVLAEVGCPGVAEGAALAAAGSDGELLVEKTKSQRATCAIARATAPIDVAAVGAPRGRLSVVGIGPGAEDWRSGEAARLLRQAGDWVGYGLYLDIVADLAGGQTQHRFALGEEEARVRHALELAATGRDVALVCSGDAGIYAMAALVYELLDASGAAAVSPAARRAEIVVAPGISALQAAAARAGAPLGHDFCAISLSDLLTPWGVIEQRLEAAAAGDFVVAFYNPKSQRRSDQIVRAMRILANKRPPQTPVIVASKLGREGESVRVRRLDRFDAEEVDMLTLVIVGSSTSRVVTLGDGRPRVYTPRGYEKKRRAAE